MVRWDCIASLVLTVFSCSRDDTDSLPSVTDADLVCSAYKLVFSGGELRTRKKQIASLC